jgi:hypothetical protein
MPDIGFSGYAAAAFWIGTNHAYFNLFITEFHCTGDINSCGMLPIQEAWADGCVHGRYDGHAISGACNLA